MPLYRLENPVQKYSWGSVDGLRDCLGIPNPAGEPHAELWMGAHPKAPSVLREDGRPVRLDDFIQHSPETCLGEANVARFGRALPFLLKALSAAKPLSVQAHPSKRKAERGYDRENLAGIPLDAPERNYRDRNHKPEMVVALTRFEGLFGFRPIPEIIENVKLVAPTEWERYVGRLERNPGRVELSVLFYTMISGDRAMKADILARTAPVIDALIEGGGVPEGRLEAFKWTRRLRDIFPGDIGALAPLLLNYVALEPGESLYVGPGQLHAYLQGEALELMGNSDNVIRGGLTEKHVDVPELVSVLTFDSDRAVPFIAKPLSADEEVYPYLAPDFRLSRVRVRGERVTKASVGPEILLCVEGEVKIEGTGGDGAAGLGRGDAAFVPANLHAFSVSGTGILYRAYVPEPAPAGQGGEAGGLSEPSGEEREPAAR